MLKPVNLPIFVDGLTVLGPMPNLLACWTTDLGFSPPNYKTAGFNLELAYSSLNCGQEIVLSCVDLEGLFSLSSWRTGKGVDFKDKLVREQKQKVDRQFI